MPPSEFVHAILDDDATPVRAWLARHQLWAFRFTATTAFWLNVVENFFSASSRRRRRRV